MSVSVFNQAASTRPDLYRASRSQVRVQASEAPALQQAGLSVVVPEVTAAETA